MRILKAAGTPGQSGTCGPGFCSARETIGVWRWPEPSTCPIIRCSSPRVWRDCGRCWVARPCGPARPSRLSLRFSPWGSLFLRLACGAASSPDCSRGWCCSARCDFCAGARRSTPTFPCRSSFLLATPALLMFHRERSAGSDGKTGSGHLILAGLMAGLAAWTKNEGLVFMAVILSVRTAIVGWESGARRATREGLVVLASAAPLLVMVIFLKSQVTHRNLLIAGQGLTETTARLFDPSRHLTIALTFIASGVQVIHAFALIIPIAFFLLGRHRDAANRAPCALLPAGVIGLMLTAYYAIYLTTPAKPSSKPTSQPRSTGSSSNSGRWRYLRSSCTCVRQRTSCLNPAGGTSVPPCVPGVQPAIPPASLLDHVQVGPDRRAGPRRQTAVPSHIGPRAHEDAFPDHRLHRDLVKGPRLGYSGHARQSGSTPGTHPGAHAPGSPSSILPLLSSTLQAPGPGSPCPPARPCFARRRTLARARFGRMCRSSERIPASKIVSMKEKR